MQFSQMIIKATVLIQLFQQVSGLGILSVDDSQASYDDIYLQNLQDQNHIVMALEKIRSNMFQNATVVASPSTKEPNYYYHWVRDSSLVITELQDWLGAKEREELLNQFARLALHHQRVAGSWNLGEPKFNIDGSLYKKPWGRPQNDGPALRLLSFAKKIKFSGDFSNTTDWWYVPTMPAKSPMKQDAEYIAHNWKFSCFDLWEEQMGVHYYSRIVMHSALKAAAYIANLRKDVGAFHFYSAQAVSLLDEMETLFWDANQMIIKSFVAETWSERTSRLDISVILACLHTRDFLVEGFTCTDDKVLLTATKLFYHFKAEYPINWGSKYPLIGRYPADLYNGTGKTLGNPWILATHAFAQLIFIVAAEMDGATGYTVTLYQYSFLDAIVPQVVQKPGLLDEETRVVLVDALRGAGRGFLDRVAQLTPSREFSEQIHRETGVLLGARDLSWSYSSYLSAVKISKHTDLY